MAAEVEQRPAARAFCVGEPRARPREPLVQRGVVRDARPTEREVAQQSVFDRLLREQNARPRARRQRDDELHPGLFDGVDDLVALRDGNGEGLLREDVLTGLRGLDHHAGVVRRDGVHDDGVDVAAGEEFVEVVVEVEAVSFGAFFAAVFLFVPHGE